MYDSVDLLKILRLKLAKYAFFRGETSIFGKKGPFCKTLLRPKRDPYVRQNFKCGPLCKATFCKTIPVKWHIRIYRVLGEPPRGTQSQLHCVTDLDFEDNIRSLLSEQIRQAQSLLTG